MNKCVWLNIETGEFSNSWEVDSNGDSIKFPAPKLDLLKGFPINSKWKLIQYTCHSDSEFEFSHLMKLR